MTTFDDREMGFEAKAAHDEEVEFKAQARRDRLLALWAGERMGLSGESLQDYVTAVWRADLKSPGDEDVYDKVMADLQAKGATVSGAELRAKMDELLAEARRELAAGG
jgi:hypothetical protein